LGRHAQTWAPTELSTWLACKRASALDAARRDERIPGPTGHDPTRDLLVERGVRHEARYLEALVERGVEVVDLRGQGSEAAIAAMARGIGAIAQATLAHDGWSGAADVLVRVEAPSSSWGAWSYEVHDTKLARETKVGTLVQLAVYSELLGALQGVRPERFWVVAPGDPFVPEPHRLKDCAAYVRAARRRYQAAALGDALARVDAHEPEPCAHCSVCRWWKDCEGQRRAVDHLSLVAGISGAQRVELRRQGITTTTALAGSPELPERPQRGHSDSFRRLHRQAAVLVRGWATQRPEHDLLAIDDAFGLQLLPAKTDRDLFLDLEADPFVEPSGREYLFGLSWVDGGEDRYSAIWGIDEAGERRAFEATMDTIMARWEQDPAMHVFHFGAYERGALARLVGRHATRASELDRLLRAGVLVDLHRVVKRTMIASVERYSLKELERFFGYTRVLPLEHARRAMRGVERALELGVPEAIDDDVRRELESYNRDDCVSTRALRDWLEALRVEVERGRELPLSRPALGEGTASDAIAEHEDAVTRMQARLREGIAEDGPRDVEEHARWLLAHLLELHRREEKASCWEKFKLQELDEEEQLRERDGVAGLEPVGEPELHNKSWLLRYRFGPQETVLREGNPLLGADGKSFGSVFAIDRIARELVVKIGKASFAGRRHPSWLFTWQMFDAKPKPQALLRLAEAIVAGDVAPRWEAARALLLRELPRLSQGVAWSIAGERGQAQAKRVVLALDRTVLAIQGPPGTGKTHTAAEMIVSLVAAGKKVGVTALGHSVIRNLLTKVEAAAGGAVRIGAKVQKVGAASGGIRETDRNDEARAWLASGQVQVIGGTPWMWANEDFAQSVDVLFVDEAGQLALADVLAVAGAAGSLVLLGDPQQLEQPRKAKHPDGTDVSALAWVIGERATIEPERGIFLEETWRLPPGICELTSELFYDGRLIGRAGLERRRLIGAGAWDGAGLWLVPVAHEGRAVEAPEEVEVIDRVVAGLLAGATWIDMVGDERRIEGRHVLVIAPYNAQVAALEAVLGPRGVRVGTVDKFQGQEAEVVVYSMTSSSIADAPKGMGFLFDRHRFNVATSRARVGCIVVASPRLLQAECASVAEVELANAVAELVERAMMIRGS
jgi:predicted RecB family nuclease